MAALSGADHKLAVVPIESGAEASTERAAAFAGHPERVQRGNGPIDHNRDQYSRHY